ncbi:MAG TPA: phosphate signaling complex protein PhoU [Bacteroidales bacterium]|jgi:phosphate transport system protein|nr:phosphate signaling complex protein PhoU [Bacteroidales bacterium]HON20260.1 phosphate signaling complex protein PhoU [Bacteroidales bacterium]HOR82808.1 phosphate signaling complex protein PhoU [Bacteroidales bacterium]HPJ91899.1 phosphate signaling complex protein PhoU [Bacteroidales bacterium]HPX59497.1 phosphate signaling complex protein PhoU [Bacteroidales bacterium]
MKYNEQEIQFLKDEINEMWKLVISQIEKSKKALLNNDVELALEIISLEKRVDAYELRLDSNCEHYIALYNPVAIDLRLVLSIMKISITLERIADYVAGIARYVVETECYPFTLKMKEALELEKMFDVLLSMMTDSLVSLNSENSKNAGKILAKDNVVDEFYHKAIDLLAEQITKETNDIRCGLEMMVLIRKMERIGDHCSNIVEEIVFYIEAKVLKHKGNKINLK